MTNPDMRALKTTPVVGIRLQSDTDFVLDGTSIANYVLPKTQFVGRQFALQLYNESFPRTMKGAKRTDTFIAGYSKVGDGRRRFVGKLHVHRPEDHGEARTDLADRYVRTHLPAEQYARAVAQPVRLAIRFGIALVLAVGQPDGFTLAKKHVSRTVDGVAQARAIFRRRKDREGAKP